MTALVVRAYLKLILFDLYMARGNFASLYHKVQSFPVKEQIVAPNTIERICSAVDTACVWYWKDALCLQRSAAIACLLKSNGVLAQMVLGVQGLPFKAHAWVEVDGQPVNERTDVKAAYSVLVGR